MKNIIFMGLICAALATIVYAPAAHTSEISDTFAQESRALKPGQNSSVRSDYLFEQIALGGEYTVRLLDQINDQNAALGQKIDAITEKFDILIDQNQKIIELLEKQSRQGE
jgi:hypothetical protein